MTNIISTASITLASLLATNMNFGICGVALTNDQSFYANVRNCVIVQREMTCPHCGKVSTNDVDVTSIHDIYERRERLNMESSNRILFDVYKQGYHNGLLDMKDAATKEVDKMRFYFKKEYR